MNAIQWMPLILYRNLKRREIKMNIGESQGVFLNPVQG
jgi:hypothetical protein